MIHIQNRAKPTRFFAFYLVLRGMSRTSFFYICRNTKNAPWFVTDADVALLLVSLMHKQSRKPLSTV